MKNNKTLIIISIILLNLLVVFMVGQAFLGKESDRDKALRQARECVEQDLCRKAIGYYKDALTSVEDLDTRIEMIAAYERGIENGEFDNAYSCFTEVEDIVELYPADSRAYEAVCTFMEKFEQYETCAELLMQAEGRKVMSEGLDELLSRVKYLYKLSYTMYSEVSSEYSGSYLVKTDDVYNVVNSELSGLLGGTYSYASSFSEGYAFVRQGFADSEYNSFVINTDGVRQCYLEGVTESSGVGKGANAKGETVLLLAGKSGEKYQYYNLKGEVVFGDYMFAGRFRNNVAAVQESENSWRLINAEGKPLIDKVFEDVILNEFDECAPKGLIFAKSGGKYYLYSASGAQIGNFSCDDARAFIDDVTAFKSGDSWGFVNAGGEVVIQPQYEDAKAFSKGIAGVANEGLWSFVDLEGNVVVEGNFEDAGYLGSNGLLFAKENGRWSALKMFYHAN